MKETKNSRAWIPLLAGAAATAIYHFIRGNGIFNHPRFSRQHDAIGRYVDTHYPGAVYAPIQSTPNGWMTVISTRDHRRISLFVSRTDDGIYLFRETEQN